MPAYITQANTGSDTLTASRTITKPGTVSSGDVGVFWLVRWNESADFPAVTPPAGAVLRATMATGDAQTLCYIIKVSSESSFVFSWTGSRWCTVSALFFSGVDPSLDLSTVPFQQTSGSGTAISTLTVTTVNTAALVWHVNTINGGSDTHTPPVNFPETWDVTAGSTAYRISPGDGDQSASGATNSGSTDWVAGLLALAPAGGGNTEVASSDAATGNESQSVSASNNSSDAGSGLEGTPQISISDGDTGSGTDSQAVTFGTSGSDTTGGSDSESISASGASSDASAGSEVAVIALMSDDAGTATESEGTTQGASSSENSGGSDDQSVSAALSESDTGDSVDSQTISAQISGSDEVTATETQDTSVASTTTPTSSDNPSVGESWHIGIAHAPVPEGSLVLGPGYLWIAPYGAVEPSNGSVGQDPDTGVWTSLGGLLGGVELSVDQEWEEIRPKQIGFNVTRRLKKRSLSIKTQLAEPTLANLAYALNDVDSLTSGSGWGEYTPADQHEGTVLDYMALIVDGWAPGANAGGRHKRRRLLVRKCLSVDTVQFAYKKDGQSVYTVTWTCHYVDASTPIFRVIDES